MIKLIISDFDGVLLDMKEIHYEALNQALATIDCKYIITPEEHTATFDGLSTKRKLELLSENKGFRLQHSREVNELKQKITLELLGNFANINPNIADVVNSLIDSGYQFYVASNAIRNTIEAGLEILGINYLVNNVFSNEDVKNSKPNPEIYLQCMVAAGVSPAETLIIEDSKHGREAAVKSGAHVCGVDNSFDFTLERINAAIAAAEPHPVKWAGKSDVTVLIPMAGAGSRFADAGFILPKPLIDVNGKPMIQHVIDNLNMDAQYVFVVQKEHYEKYNLESYLKLMAPNCKIVLAGELRNGAAWDTLLAKEFIDNDRHLIIANSDQFVEWDSCQFMYSMISDCSDGGILTFTATESKWSYAKLGDDGYVSEVAEKKPISEHATVGIYYWKHGKDYVASAEQMIAKNIRVNNEFYVCPVFNEAIGQGKKVKIFPAKKMWGLGTPEDLSHFLKNYSD